MDDTASTATAASLARVPTGNGSRYLQQLCKHWSHKFTDTTFDAAHGVVPFPNATCTFDAVPDILSLRLEAPADDLTRMEEVVAKHLQRFAFREELDIRWTRAADIA